ncbi:MAG: YjjG family noncanonical pyrimidine nucleotidase [Bacteroidetes bacterium]|nr:YjjG family noncanonical pyrimidine nucleotidase [Bacteroidota bacterium]
MRYSLLLFDADGTLYDYEKGEVFALKKSLEEFGIENDFDKNLLLYKSINSALWREFELKKISADDLKVERFNRLFTTLNKSVNTKKFSDVYLENLSKATFIFQGVDHLLEELFPLVPMVIITNGLKQVQRPRFDRSSIGKYMQEYIISEEIGLQKPDPGIFEYAFRKLNFKEKNSALIIGDNLHSDILGGLNYGIDTCWFNPANQINDTEIRPTYTISKLTDLKKIIAY